MNAELHLRENEGGPIAESSPRPRDLSPEGAASLGGLEALDFGGLEVRLGTERTRSGAASLRGEVGPGSGISLARDTATASSRARTERRARPSHRPAGRRGAEADAPSVPSLSALAAAALVASPPSPRVGTRKRPDRVAAYRAREFALRAGWHGEPRPVAEFPGVLEAWERGARRRRMAAAGGRWHPGCGRRASLEERRAVRAAVRALEAAGVAS